MRIQELFRPADIIVGFEPSDKWDGIEQMMIHLREIGRIHAEVEPALSDAVMARERSMSTGMEHGLAIPHAAVEGLEDVVACLAVVQGAKGVNFESIDGSETHFVVLLLIPRAQKLLHIRTLADVARVFGNEGVRSALMTASSAEEAWHALGEGEGAV
jgi:mannitol/fructose-specific phosphotransferase system IIA component (Ntr-type)